MTNNTNRQLLQTIINIQPQNYQSVIDSIIPIINSINQLQHNNKQINDIVKSIFYGLWNFDKMINQHNLSTKIAKSLHLLNLPQMKYFLLALFSYLNQKWNLIDHHRINKFMQLVRYLMTETIQRNIKQININANQKNIKKKSNKNTPTLQISNKPNQIIDQILLKTVFSHIDSQIKSGIQYHVTQIYYSVLHKILQEKQPESESRSSFNNYTLFLDLLLKHPLQHFRLHIQETVFAKYKQNATQEDIKQFIKKLLSIAQQQQNDLVRKNIYFLVGFMKSQETNFHIYSIQKQQNRVRQKQIRDMNKKKKITKQKKKNIKQAKIKRKQKNKQKNKKFKQKTTSGKRGQLRHLMPQQF